MKLFKQNAADMTKLLKHLYTVKSSFRAINNMILDVASNESLLKASHKSTPSSVFQGIVDLYSTLGHVGDGNSCGGMP
jgi:hypothetical protein